MVRIYHNIWLIKDKVFYFALLVSLLWHIGLFSMLSISNISIDSKKAQEVRLSFLQNKWTDKNIDLPGRKYEIYTDSVFATQSLTAPMLDTSLKDRLKTFYLQQKSPVTTGLTFDTAKSSISQRTEYKKPVNKQIFNDIFKSKLYKVVIENKKEATGHLDIIQGYSKEELLNNLTGPVKRRDLLHWNLPEFPDWAQLMKLEFEVVLRFWVEKDGFIRAFIIEKSSGYPEIDSLLSKNIKQWRFQPLPMDAPHKHQWGLMRFKFCLTHDNEQETEIERSIHD